MSETDIRFTVCVALKDASRVLIDASQYVDTFIKRLFTSYILDLRVYKAVELSSIASCDRDSGDPSVLFHLLMVSILPFYR